MSSFSDARSEHDDDDDDDDEDVDVDRRLPPYTLLLPPAESTEVFRKCSVKSDALS